MDYRAAGIVLPDPLNAVSKASAARLKAVIFDLDGTLVDSRLDFAAMREETGAPDDIGLLEFVDTLRSASDRRAVMETIHRHEMAGANAATWISGAEAVLHTLYDRQVPIGIVTRNSRSVAMRTMQRLQMPPIPLMAREDAAPKPNPEALLAMASQWRIEAKQCAYIGDYHYDTEAAERAGMLPLLYTGGGPVPAGTAPNVVLVHDFLDVLNFFEDGQSGL